MNGSTALKGWYENRHVMAAICRQRVSNPDCAKLTWPSATLCMVHPSVLPDSTILLRFRVMPNFCPSVSFTCAKFPWNGSYIHTCNTRELRPRLVAGVHQLSERHGARRGAPVDAEIVMREGKDQAKQCCCASERCRSWEGIAPRSTVICGGGVRGDGIQRCRWELGEYDAETKSCERDGEGGNL